MKILKNRYEKYWLMGSDGKPLGRIKAIWNCEQICTMKDFLFPWCYQQLILIKKTKKSSFPQSNTCCFQIGIKIVKDEDIKKR